MVWIFEGAVGDFEGFSGFLRCFGFLGGDVSWLLRILVGFRDCLKVLRCCLRETEFGREEKTLGIGALV